MIYVIEFTHALKSSWNRRLLQQKKPNKQTNKQKTNWFSVLEAEMKT